MNIPENVKYECEKCDCKAIQQSSLIRHIMSSHGGNKYPCSKCDSKFSTKSYLIYHEMSIPVKNMTKIYHFKRNLKIHGLSETLNNVRCKLQRKLTDALTNQICSSKQKLDKI